VVAEERAVFIFTSRVQVSLEVFQDNLVHLSFKAGFFYSQ
jgi:hypothetical protein